MKLNPYIEKIKRKALLAKKWIRIRGYKKADYILHMFGINHAQYRKYAGGRLLHSCKSLVVYDKIKNNLETRQLMKKYSLSQIQVLLILRETITLPKLNTAKRGRPAGGRDRKLRAKRKKEWHKRKLRKKETEPRKPYKKRNKEKKMRKPQFRLSVDCRYKRVIEKTIKRIKKSHGVKLTNKQLTEEALDFIVDNADKFEKFLMRDKNENS